LEWKSLVLFFGFWNIPPFGTFYGHSVI
jgi:hypothetical protein